MAYREFMVVEVRAILRWWLGGLSLRAVAAKTGCSRVTIRHYVRAAQEEGLRQADDPAALTDELLSRVMARVRPGRKGDHGEAWQLCEQHRAAIQEYVDQGLTLVKVHQFLTRKKIVVPYRTLHRFASTQLGFGGRRNATTVRLDDPKPGSEVQIDFGSLGILFDPVAGQRRRLKVLICTAVYSRHCFVWPLWSECFTAVVEGLEAAWRFFGGVFPVVIPDNFKAVVTDADPLTPRISEQFADYAEARGIAIDTARVRRPKDKARVERSVTYVRDNFFAGEEFKDLEDVRRRAEHWCRITAGLRTHGTTQLQPATVFEVEERPRLLPAPATPYDVPIFADAKVGRDQHFSFGRALYSMPKELVGRRVHVRGDSQLVKVWLGGEFLRAHPRQPPGGRHTVPEDIDVHRRPYAQRDPSALIALAEQAGPSVSTYAQRLLDDPHPWRSMRHLYRLLNAVRRYGEGPVDRACTLALELDVIDVVRVERIVQMAGDSTDTEPPAPAPLSAKPRFARPDDHFKVIPFRKEPS